jgi:hypothetical protein
VPWTLANLDPRFGDTVERFRQLVVVARRRGLS